MDNRKNTRAEAKRHIVDIERQQKKSNDPLPTSTLPTDLDNQILSSDPMEAQRQRDQQMFEQEKLEGS